MSFLKNLFKGNPDKTLIVFDLCNLTNRITDWSFIDKYENPVLLIYYDDRVSDQLKEFEAKYPIVKIALPSDIRQIPSFILAMSLTEFFQEKTYKKMVFAAVQSHYELVLKSLATKGVPLEFLLLEYVRQEIKPRNKENTKPEHKKREHKPQDSSKNKVQPVEKQKETVLTKEKTEAKDEPQTLKKERLEKPKKERIERVEKESISTTEEVSVEKTPEIRSLNPDDLTLVCDFFLSKFSLEDTVSKITLGGYIKQVTGKGYDKIFFTRDYNRFVNILLAAGCVEKTDDDNLIIKKAPTVTIFPSEVEVIPSLDRPRGFHKKRFPNKRFQNKD